VLNLRQSSIRQHMNCERAYYLEQVLGCKEPASNYQKMSTADTGTLVHAGLDAWYDYGSVEAVNVAITDACGVILEAKKLDLMEGVKPTVLAGAMVLRYIGWVDFFHMDDGFTQTETEVPFKIEYNEHEYTGTIDLVTYDEILGGWVILDHKTVANMTQQPRPNDFQLTHYAWSYYMITGRVPVAAGHNLLKRSLKTGDSQRALININAEMLDLHADKLVTLRNRMQQTWEVKAPYAPSDVPSNPTGECNWKCRVKDLCDIMDDPGNHWQGMAETVYQVNKERLK